MTITTLTQLHQLNDATANLPLKATHLLCDLCELLYLPLSQVPRKTQLFQEGV